MTMAELHRTSRRGLPRISGGALRALLTLPAVAGSVLVLLIGLAWLGRYEVVGLAAWISAGLLTLTAPGEALSLRVRGIRALAPSEAQALANCWNAALKDCRHDASRLQLRLSTETKVNAYAAGGRCVAVTQGALTEFLTGNLSREHLTAVLTHEIGHHQTNSTRLPLLADYFALPGRRLLHLAARLMSAFVPRQPRLLLQTIAVSAVTMACISTANADHWAALTVLGGGSLAALVCPVADAAIARRLEFKADGVARQAGHGRALAELLRTFDQGPESHRLLVRHPRIDRRVQRLEDALLDNEGQQHVRYPNVTVRRSKPVSTTSKCVPSQVRTNPVRTRGIPHDHHFFPDRHRPAPRRDQCRRLPTLRTPPYLSARKRTPYPLHQSRPLPPLPSVRP